MEFCLQEKLLIRKYDTTKIPRHDAWFLVAQEWFDKWTKYMDNPAECTHPGPLDTKPLMDSYIRIKPNLKVSRDYRCVNPQVFAIFERIYGLNGPILSRWILDIYGDPVPAEEVKEILYGPRLLAKSKVAEIYHLTEDSVVDQESDASALYRFCCRCDGLILVLGWSCHVLSMLFSSDSPKDIQFTSRRRIEKDNDEESDDEDDDTAALLRV